MLIDVDTGHVVPPRVAISFDRVVTAVPRLSLSLSLILAASSRFIGGVIGLRLLRTGPGRNARWEPPPGPTVGQKTVILR